MRGVYVFVLNLCFVSVVKAHEHERCDCRGIQELTATQNPGYFESPNYNGHVCPDIECTWKIEAEDTKSTVFLRFLWFAIEKPVEGTCKEESVTIRDGDFLYSPQIAQICGNPHPSPEINSTSRTMVVTFSSSKMGRSYGFKAQYRMVTPKAGPVTNMEVVLACAGLAIGGLVVVIGISILIIRKRSMSAAPRSASRISGPESANIYAIDNKALKLDEMPEILLTPPSYDEVCGGVQKGAK